MRIKLCSAHFFTNQISTQATVLGIRRFVVAVEVVVGGSQNWKRRSAKFHSARRRHYRKQAPKQLSTVSRYEIVDANTYKDLNLQEAIRIFNQTALFVGIPISRLLTMIRCLLSIAS